MSNMKYLLSFILGIALVIGATSALAVGAFPVATGGTGSTTLSGVLIGNGTSPINSLTIGSGLNLIGTTLSAIASATGLGTTSPWTSGFLAYVTDNGHVSSVATSTLTGGTGLTGSFTYVGTGGALSFASIAANSLWVNRTGATAVPTVLATSSLGIAISDTTGTLAVNRGGTGAATLTGCLTGNGTGAITGSGTCNTSNATVSSVGLSSTNSTLTVGSTPVTTSGTITADLNLAHSNIWTVLQSFLFASSTLSSHTSTAYFGATATTSINADGLGSIKTASTGSITDTGLGTAAGTFIAADPMGKLIATTTPSSATPNPTVLFHMTGTRPTSSSASQIPLLTYKVPANTLGINDTLRITMQFWNTGVSNTFKPTILVGNGAATTSSAATVQNSFAMLNGYVTMDNATNAELIGFTTVGDTTGMGSSPLATSTYDTTSPLYITASCALTTGGDTCNLMDFFVERITP